MASNNPIHLLNGQVDPTKEILVDPETLRWAARQRMAIWSFRIMAIMTASLISYGMFYPGGADVINSLSPFIFTLYGSYTAIVAGYMGIDAVSRRNAD
jgi:hypothetical protein